MSVCPWGGGGGAASRVCLVREGVCLQREGSLPSDRGSTYWLGGLPSEGVCLRREECLSSQGWGLPPILWEGRVPKYGQPVFGMHPTGMHSCYCLQTNFTEGNVFTVVYLSTGGRGCRSLPQTSPDRDPLGRDPTDSELLIHLIADTAAASTHPTEMT